MNNSGHSDHNFDETDVFLGNSTMISKHEKQRLKCTNPIEELYKTET